MEDVDYSFLMHDEERSELFNSFHQEAWNHSMKHNPTWSEAELRTFCVKYADMRVQQMKDARIEFYNYR